MVKTLTLNQKMVKTLSVTTEEVKTLAEGIRKMKVKFDRVEYRRLYDKTYFKRKTVCPRCGETKVRHMLKRHMMTKKCLSTAQKK